MSEFLGLGTRVVTWNYEDMPPTSITKPPLDRQPCRAARQMLAETFDSPFDLWVFSDESWRRIPEDDKAELEPCTTELAATLELMRDSKAQARCVPLPGGGQRLLLPLPRLSRRPLAAVGDFPEENERSLLRLSRLCLTHWTEHQELVRLRQEHDAFLRQVTNDFEELTFLRSMSKLLEISDLSFDFLAMAETMLPTLKPLLDSENLLLIQAETEPSTGEPIPRSVLEMGKFLTERALDDESCLKLVARYQRAAAIQPVVKNNLSGAVEGHDLPGVNAFVLVPIVNSDLTIGWLLALNRNNERNLNLGDLPWGVSYLEFGTHEATLMSSSAAILATHSRNVDLFREREELLVSVVRALVSAIEAKDEYTRGHSERVALYGQRLAKELGYDEEYCERLYLTGLLHDVGKIGVRDAVLRKPGPLTDEEFEEIKQHPDKGWQILHDLNPLQYVLDGVLHHHEQYDGRGYPDRLAAHSIPLDGRILAVADAYDAMTSDRPYRTGMPQEKAEAILRSGSGKQWDPIMIEAFFRCMPDILQIKKAYQPRLPETRKPVDTSLTLAT